jgi:hypothetical protein
MFLAWLPDPVEGRPAHTDACAGHAVRGTTSSRIVERFAHVVNYTPSQSTPQLRASAPM